jgi:hypothetical protein
MAAFYTLKNLSIYRLNIGEKLYFDEFKEDRG